ncbi:Flp pilus assembly complex ATPase component TadA [candidate division WOR-3 bacterium]|nr:Flp pilus assembly complex ATPase component TadA [candidate division WOR-3 bacterium]
MNVDFLSLSEKEMAEKLVQKLLEKNLIKKENLEKIQRHSIISSQNILAALVQTKTVSEESVFENFAELIGLPFIHIDPLSLDLEIVTGAIPQKYSKHNKIVPLSREGDKLTVAFSDPSVLKLKDEIENQLHTNLKFVLAKPSDIEKVIEGFFSFHSALKAAESLLRSGTLESKNIFNKEYLSQTETEVQPNIKPIVTAVDNLFSYAFEQRASDIHIEPKRNLSLVRMRIDGILHDVHVIPNIVHSAIVSRIKILSGLDISQKRIPQDGRIKKKYKENELEIRISTIPTVFGEKVVMRIFDPDVLLQNIDDLGFFEDDMLLVREFLGHNEGILLLTGPTGSGKTTSLYSLLKELSRPEVNIVTIEDPVELVYEDFNQIPVDNKSGIGFANALRNVLRQDPDIIMVGEIRDTETAEYAIQAALTGHLVFSTLHTIDAPSAISRMINLGIPKFLLSSTLIGVIAQRLIRKNCPYCSEDFSLPPEATQALEIATDSLSQANLKIGKGCVQCRGTGFLYRTGIFEILKVTPEIRKLIVRGESLNSIRGEAKRNGMRNLREAATAKMLLGETSYKEVFRVTGSSHYLVEDY